jgi:thiol-disulfide isomerase/thioredoxin
MDFRNTPHDKEHPMSDTGATVAVTDDSFSDDVLASATPVLVDFWATWCGPCKVEIPWFIEFQNTYGKNGLQVVGVSVDDTLPKLKPYVAQMKMNYPVLQGLDHEDIQDAYGPLLGIPVTVLISRDAKICMKHAGLHSKDAFDNQIKALLGL